MGSKKSMTQHSNKYAGMEGVSLSLTAKGSGEYKVFNIMRHRLSRPSMQKKFDDLVTDFFSLEEELKEI